jgi:hypothetical protein
MNRFVSHLARCAAAATLALGGLAFALPANADVPGAHPGYLHGLDDLRAAGLRELDAAFRDARRAAAYDGKNLADHPPVDANVYGRRRLDAALVALQDAHAQFTQYESNGPDRGWQHRTVVHVDAAIAHVKRAMADRRYDGNHGF